MECSRVAELSLNDLKIIFTNEHRFRRPINGIYQIIHIRSEGFPRYAMISDGIYSCQAWFYVQHDLSSGDIFRVTEAKALMQNSPLTNTMRPIEYKLKVAGCHILQRATALITDYGVLIDSFLASREMDSKIMEMCSINYVPIAQLSPELKDWTVKGRISYKSNLKVWDNGKKALLSLTLFDESGSIRLTAFHATAIELQDVIKWNECYQISEAQLHPSKPRFSHLGHKYEINLTTKSQIEGCANDEVPPYKYKFVDFDILHHGKHERPFDILGIVHSLSETFEIISRRGESFLRRDMILVDHTGFSVKVGLWNERAKHCRVKAGDIIASNAVHYKNYGDPVITLGNSSEIIVNDLSLPEVRVIRDWYQKHGYRFSFTPTNITSMKSRIGVNSMKFIDQRVTITHILQSNLGMSVRADYFSLKATIDFIRSTNYCYVACPQRNCLKKLNAEASTSGFCPNCGTFYIKPEFRFLGTICLADHTGRMFVSVYNDHMAELFGVDASTLRSLEYSDTANFDSIFKRASGQSYDFRIKGQEVEISGLHSLRYTVVNMHKLNFRLEADYLARHLEDFLHNA